MALFRGRPYSYWLAQWDREDSGSDYQKSLQLLVEYAGGFKSPFGGYFYSKFFSGRWNSHHTSTIAQIVNKHLNSQHTMEDLLKDLENDLGKIRTKISGKGDLATIINVIIKNTPAATSPDINLTALNEIVTDSDFFNTEEQTKKLV